MEGILPAAALLTPKSTAIPQPSILARMITDNRQKLRGQPGQMAKSRLLGMKSQVLAAGMVDSIGRKSDE